MLGVPGPVMAPARATCRLARVVAVGTGMHRIQPLMRGGWLPNAHRAAFRPARSSIAGQMVSGRIPRVA